MAGRFETALSRIDALEARCADMEEALAALLNKPAEPEPKTKKEPTKAQKEPK